MTRAIGERYRDYYKFAIVRNPWALIASAYRFATQGVSTDKQGLAAEGYRPARLVD